MVRDFQVEQHGLVEVLVVIQNGNLILIWVWPIRVILWSVLLYTWIVIFVGALLFSLTKLSVNSSPSAQQGFTSGSKMSVLSSLTGCMYTRHETYTVLCLGMLTYSFMVFTVYSHELSALTSLINVWTLLHFSLGNAAFMVLSSMLMLTVLGWTCSVEFIICSITLKPMIVWERFWPLATSMGITSSVRWNACEDNLKVTSTYPIKGISMPLAATRFSVFEASRMSEKSLNGTWGRYSCFHASSMTHTWELVMSQGNAV